MLTFQSQTIKVPTPKIWMAKGWQNLWLFLETHSNPLPHSVQAAVCWMPGKAAVEAGSLWRSPKKPKSITQITPKKPEEFEAHSLMFNH